MVEERVTARVMDVQYDDEDELYVRLMLRTENNERFCPKVYGVVPYLFLHEDAKNPQHNDYLAQFVKGVYGGYESFDGHSLMQVTTHSPSDVRKVRDKYDETWEADLPFVRRCTADYGMSGFVSVPYESSFHVSEIESVDAIDISPRVCTYDIEVDAPDSFYDEFAEEAPNEVQAITAHDSYEDEYVLFALDSELSVNAGRIRSEIEKHWNGHDEYDDLIDVDIRFKRFSSESVLLSAFVEYVSERQFDVFTGWNVVDFDHEYIVSRMHSVDGVSPHQMSDIGSVGGRRPSTYVDGTPAIDLMEAFCGKLSYGEWESQSLDYVSNDVIGGGKVEGDDVSYEANRTKFMAYNIVDVQLCVELNERRGILSFWYLLAEITGIPPYDVGSTMKECEGYLFKHRDNDEILPSTEETDMDRIEGGLVLPPHEGIEPWVGVFDLKSLYPSSIITCNISKETMTTDIEEADIVVPDVPLNYEKVAGDTIESQDITWEPGKGACVGFTLDEQGILPKYLTKLFEDREKRKELRNQYSFGTQEFERYNQQQRAVKVVMSSFFGVSDNPYFRLSADGLGAAITSVSRYVSWGGVRAISDQGYNVLYGDTDSLMVSMASSGVESKDPVVEDMEALEDDINSNLSFIADSVGLPDDHPFLPESFHGTGRHAWFYEAEKLYRRFLQAGTKKRYAGNIVWKEGKSVDELDVSGFEVQKSDATEITQRVQSELLTLALDGASFEEMTEYIQDEIAGVKNSTLSPQEVGFPSTLSQPIEEYPNRPVKRAAKYSNKHLGYDWQSGTDPWLVYVDDTSPGLPNTDVIALSWTDDSLPSGFTMDATTHIEKNIKKPVESLVDAFDFTWSELKTGRQEQSFLGEKSERSSEEPMFGESPATDDPFEDM